MHFRDLTNEQSDRLRRMQAIQFFFLVLEELHQCTTNLTKTANIIYGVSK